MKKNNIMKYTIALFVCFFTLLFKVEAAVSTYSFDLPITQNFSIGTPTYSNMTCSHVDSGNSSIVSITNDGSGVSVVKYHTEDTAGKEVQIRCTWQDSSMGITQNGEALYKFKLNNDESASPSTGLPINEVNIRIGTIAGFRRDGHPVGSNVVSYLGTGYSFNASDVSISSGGSYIEFRGGSCSSSQCIVQPSAAAESGSGRRSFDSKFVIRATYNGTQYDVTINVHIDMSGGTRIYPGNYSGVSCGVPNSEWKSTPGTYFEAENANPTLPNCTVDSTEYSFEGWNKTNPDGLNNAEIDRCYNTVGGGTTAESGASYTICLKSKPHITIAFGSGSLIANGDNWVRAGSDYAYRYSDSTSVKLPKIDAEGFVGWRKNSYSGPLVEADTEVPVDGSRYFAEIQSSRVYTDMNKTVRTSKTMPITYPNLTGCSLAEGAPEGKVTVTFNETAHECQVTGVEATEGEEKVDVKLTFGGDSPRVATYHFKVVDSAAAADPGDSAVLDINTYYNVIYGENNTGDGGSGIFTSGAKKLWVNWGAKNKASATFFGGSFSVPGGASYSSGDGGSGTVQSSYYKVCTTESAPSGECPSSGNPEQFWAFCLDPGLHGPDHGWDQYIVDPKDLSNSEHLKKLISYANEKGVGGSYGTQMLTASLLSDAENIYRIAIHHATRFAALMDGIDSGKSAFPGRYKWYQQTAQEIKNLGDHPSKEDVYNKIVAFFSNHDEYPIDDGASRDKIADLIATYFNESADQDISSGKIERIIENVEVDADDSDMTNVVEISIVVPSATTSMKLSGFNSGLTDIRGQILDDSGNPVDSYNIADESCEDNGDGRKKCKVKVKLSKPLTSTKKLPSTDEEKMDASFKFEFSGANIEKMFLATSKAHGHSWQRMLMFNTGEADIRVYVPFKPDCGKLIDKTPRDDAVKQAIVANQCCSYLSDSEIEDGGYLEMNCAKKCYESTFAQVCSYAVTPGMVDVYKIEEAKLDGENQIGLCVVNVTDPYDASNVDNFVRTDQNANKYNVEAFAGANNKYCEVTCKEDWTIVMEAYGNYVGLNAVAAGSYFRIKTNDTFMGNKTECYSTYIDYAKYTEEQSNLSKTVVDEYNSYSTSSHAYTDIKKIKEANDLGQISVEVATGCIKRDSCANTYPGVEGGSSWDSEAKECYHMETCTCPPDDDDCVCPKRVTDGEPKCLEEGSVHTYKLKAKRNVVGTREDYDKTYIHSSKTSNKDTDGDPNNNNTITTSHELGDSIGTSMKADYDGEIHIECSYEWADEENEISPDVTCTAPASDTNSSNGAYSHSYGGDSIDNFCNNNADANGTYCKVDDAGDGGAKQDAFDEMTTQFMDHTEQQERIHSGNLSSATSTIYGNADKFFACQHFQLENTSDLPSNATNNKMFFIDNAILGKKGEYTKIETKFKPGASYKYDDDAYMTLLGDENVVEQYLDRNNHVLDNSYVPGESTDTYSTTSNFRKEYTIDSVNGADPSGAPVSGEEKVYLSKNYLEASYYWSKDPWPANDQKSKDYNDDSSKIKYDDANHGPLGNGDSSEFSYQKGKITLCTIEADIDLHTYSVDSPKSPGGVMKEVVAVLNENPEWLGGVCFEVMLRYNDVNYVKTSIENGSFYKNKGNWYFSDSNGMYVAHGDTPQAALENLASIAYSTGGATDASAIPKDNSNWKQVGEMNVFPISYSTPRNLYTYTYYFGDMGYYYDSQNLGRIMGGVTPIIKKNDRTCFYEVYEEVCRCCASDLYDYGYDPDSPESEDNVNPQSLLPSMPLGSPDYSFSDYAAIKTNDKSYLGIVPSTVQLADFNSDQDRELPSNWGVTEFYYDGTNYKIDKGREALKYIESKGETIYMQDPQNEYNLEYSFTLTPSVLAEIKEYNNDNGYDISHDRVTLYGRYLNGADQVGKLYNPIDLLDADTISFVHYGSVFLESELPRDAINRSLSNLGDSICYVETTFSDDEDNNDLDNKVTDKMKSGDCRWVDFIINAEYSSQHNPVAVPDDVVPVEFFRMAFK